MSTESERMDDYTVLVDFHCSTRDINDLAHQYAHADFIDEIGTNQHQVGFGVTAPNVGEAYRCAVNAVIASQAMLGLSDPAILGSTVYDGDDEVTFD